MFLGLGLLVGPEGPLGLINEGNISSLKLVTTVALGMIIFLVGDRLRFDALRPQLRRLLSLNLLQIVAAGGLVFAATLALGASFRLAFVLGLIAAETGILTVTATVREERARGEFTENLLTSVGLTNVLVAGLFGVTFPFVLATSPDVSGPSAVVTAFLQIVVASTIVGIVGGWLMTRVGSAIETSGELLLFVIVMVTGMAGAVLAVDGSVVVATLLAGVYTANRAPWLADRFFEAVRTLEAPIYLVFFVVAGAGIHLDELGAVGLLGIAYVVARFAGKTLGSLLGSRLDPGLPSQEALRLGTGMLPHAGMAIALVAFVVEQAPTLGDEVSGVVLGSIVVFELTGPMLLRRVLRSSGDSGRAPAALAAAVQDLDEDRRINRIVMPVGNTSVALPRIPLLFDLAAQLGAELVAVHVSRPGQRSRNGEEPEVLRLVRQLAESHGVNCSTRHRVSERVSVAIADTVREEDADLLIMGQPLHSSVIEATGWSRTTERVAHLVDVPVLVYTVDPHDPTAIASSVQLLEETSASSPDGRGLRALFRRS